MPITPPNLDLAPELALLYLSDAVPGAPGLLEQLRHGVAWDRRMQARQTACFGLPYAYSGVTYPELAMPPHLAALGERVHALVGVRVNSCLLNLYVDGEARMGFHSDSERDLAPESGVAVISLGSPRTLVFRRIDDPSQEARLCLEPGSLLHMTSASQRIWRHGIRREAGAGTRISATFRRLLPAPP